MPRPADPFTLSRSMPRDHEYRIERLEKRIRVAQAGLTESWAWQFREPFILYSAVQTSPPTWAGWVVTNNHAEQIDYPGFAPSALDVRCVLTATAWTIGYGGLITRNGSGVANSNCFTFSFSGTRRPSLAIATTGTNVTTYNASTSFANPGAGNPYCVRATWDGVAGEIKFYGKTTSIGNEEADRDSNSGWSQIGTTQTGTLTGVLFDPLSSYGSVPFRIGRIGSDDIDATIACASIATTIDGSPSYDFNVADSGGFARWTDPASGNQWTMSADNWNLESGIDGWLYNKGTQGNIFDVPLAAASADALDFSHDYGTLLAPTPFPRPYDTYDYEGDWCGCPWTFVLAAGDYNQRSYMSLETFLYGEDWDGWLVWAELILEPGASYVYTFVWNSVFVLTANCTLEHYADIPDYMLNTTKNTIIITIDALNNDRSKPYTSGNHPNLPAGRWKLWVNGYDNGYLTPSYSSYPYYWWGDEFVQRHATCENIQNGGYDDTGLFHGDAEYPAPFGEHNVYLSGAALGLAVSRTSPSLCDAAYWATYDWATDPGFAPGGS